MRFVRTALAATAAAALAFVQTSAHAAPAPPPTVIIFAGGLGSTPADELANFGPLRAQLTPLGYTVSSVFAYGQTLQSVPDATLSCQPIETSTLELAETVRWFRDHGQASSVILVGHSLGGVIALGVPSTAPDLAPFIRRIVTVDSPLEGINEFEYSFSPLAYHGADSCPAVDELYERGASPSTRGYLAQLVEWEQAAGIDVAVVDNPHDGAVDISEQGIYGPPVNYTIDAQAPGLLRAPNFDHSSVLHVPAATAQLASIVAR